MPRPVWRALRRSTRPVWPSSPLRPRPCASRKRRPPQRRPRLCRRAPTPIRAIASRWSPTTRALPITAARPVIPATRAHPGIPETREAPAAPATGADPAAPRRKGGFPAWPRPTAAAPIRTRRTPAPRPPVPSATTTPWAWRCPSRCRTTAATSGAPWRSSTAARPSMPR